MRAQCVITMSLFTGSNAVTLKGQTCPARGALVLAARGIWSGQVPRCQTGRRLSQHVRSFKSRGTYMNQGRRVTSISSLSNVAKVR